MRSPFVLFSEAWQALLDLFFPPPQGCIFCGSQKENGEICPECRKQLAAYRLRVGCFVCGAFAEGGPAARQSGLCAECQKLPPPFQAARALGPYEGLLKETVVRLKFGGERWLARPLGRLLADLARELVILGEKPYLVPVPLSRGRLQERGYNQAEELAREMSHALGWPLVKVLAKIRETPPQVGLPGKERLTNPAGSFAPTGRLPPGSAAVLVDDVLTTGATASACSRALLEAGVSTIFVVTLVNSRYVDKILAYQQFFHTP